MVIEQLYKKIDSQNQRYVFTVNNETIGFFNIISRPNRSSREIWCFGLSGEYRRKGLGQQMLRELIDIFGDKPLELGCHKSNSVALHIYQKFGFNIIEDRGDHYWMRREVEAL